MVNARGTEQPIRPVAEESLETFEKVAKAAEANLQSAASGNSSTSIVRNTFTEQETIQTHRRITQENIEGNSILSREPAIAHVVVVDENRQRTTYYFSRAAAAPSPNKGLKFVSYRTQVGQLAELRIGDEYELPRAG
jgi:DNA helicase IV